MDSDFQDFIREEQIKLTKIPKRFINSTKSKIITKNRRN